MAKAGTQGRNLDKTLLIAAWLPDTTSTPFLIQSRAGIVYSGLGASTSITNLEDILQIWPRANLRVSALQFRFLPSGCINSQD